MGNRVSVVEGSVPTSHSPSQWTWTVLCLTIMWSWKHCLSPGPFPHGTAEISPRGGYTTHQISTKGRPSTSLKLVVNTWRKRLALFWGGWARMMKELNTQQLSPFLPRLNKGSLASFLEENWAIYTRSRDEKLSVRNPRWHGLSLWIKPDLKLELLTQPWGAEEGSQLLWGCSTQSPKGPSRVAPLQW